MEDKIEYLVADTTAFINAVPLNEMAKNVLTVPDVMEEVRNKRQIRRLCVLPFNLEVREPRPENVRHCVEFAKKTGDYASLSGIDIKVIALTYELEVEHLGNAHLRTEPVVSRVVASKDKPVELQDNTKLPGWYNPTGHSDDDIESDASDEEAADNDGQKNRVGSVKATIQKEIVQAEGEEEEDEQEDVTQEQLEEMFEQLKCDTNGANDSACDLLIPESQSNEADQEEAEENNKDNEEEGGGWITPSNIKQIKKALGGKVEDDVVPKVACMSTDYALQNVLKQINLQILALNGRVIRNLRTYILRCYSCFKTTSVITKLFCPNCGNKTLKRVAVSLDDNGKQVIHINTRRPLTRKYKNQSLPRFQGGKHSRNPILFEDQPIPRQMPSRVAKTKTNALEDDYVAGYSPFVMRDVDSRSAQIRAKGNLKEWARNNTFEEDRRRRHYNRLYK